MVNYTYELSKEHICPNISIYARFRDDVQVGWRVTAEDGYALTRKRTELDAETGEEIIVTTHHSKMYLPLRYNWKSFSLVAVPRSEVGEEKF